MADINIATKLDGGAKRKPEQDKSPGQQTSLFRKDRSSKYRIMHRYAALDSPLLRVSRPVAACSRCRAAKIKCDGKLPACTACEKVGRENECSSSNDQFAKGKERSYVASLESRVEKLEKRIQYAKSRKASVNMHDGEGSLQQPADRKDSLAAIRAAIHGKAARRREAVDVNELVSDFGFMSVNATTRDFDTSSTNLTFARLIFAAALNEELPKLKTQQMPPRAKAMSLLQYYLESVYCLYPAFPETALFHALDGVYSDPPRSLIDFEYWLLFMVLAIASVSKSRSSNDIYYKEGVSFVVRALKHADHVLMPGYATQIQALILLVQYSMLDPKHFDSWHLAGFMCRAVVDLGFHQDPPKELQPDKKTLEQRRKLFYCAYALDRSISMVHARPFSFTDDATQVLFPTTLPATLITFPLSITSTPTSLHPSLLLFQLRKAQSVWYQELFQSSRSPLQQANQYLWQMCYEMRIWAEKLLVTLSPTMRELFDLELLYSYVYCLAPSCRFPAVSELGKTLIFEYSMSYISSIHRVLIPPPPNNISNKPSTAKSEGLEGHRDAFTTYHDALRTYFIASQFLAVLQSNFSSLLDGAIPYVNIIPGAAPPPPIPNVGRTDNCERAQKAIERVLEVLGAMGQRWNDARALAGNFEGMTRDVVGRLGRRAEERRIKRDEEAYGGLAPAGGEGCASLGIMNVPMVGAGHGSIRGQNARGGVGGQWEMGKFEVSKGGNWMEC